MLFFYLLILHTHTPKSSYFTHRGRLPVYSSLLIINMGAGPLLSRESNFIRKVALFPTHVGYETSSYGLRLFVCVVASRLGRGPPDPHTHTQKYEEEKDEEVSFLLWFFPPSGLPFTTVIMIFFQLVLSSALLLLLLPRRRNLFFFFSPHWLQHPMRTNSVEGINNSASVS